MLAALNGVLGDYLGETGNPLAIEMRLRHGGHPLELERQALRAALPQATRKLVVLVHGSCMNDRQWTRQGHDHGAALARDLGYTPGLPPLQQRACTSRPTAASSPSCSSGSSQRGPVPLDELVIVAHSMGGLVARSACHVGEAAGHAWRPKLRKLVCLGSPHHGAPLERGGNWIDLLLGVSRYSAPLARLGKIRSAGVTDLRFGNVLDEHWEGRDRFGHAGDPRGQLELPDGVQCYAIAATKSRGRRRQALGRRPGPGGQRARPAREAGADARVSRGAPVDRLRDGSPRSAQPGRGVRDDPVVALLVNSTAPSGAMT